MTDLRDGVRPTAGQLVIAWQDPPPNSRGRRQHPLTGVDLELKKRPGKWACIAQAVAPSYAQTVRRSVLADDRFEVVARNLREIDGRKRCDVYARWLGPADARPGALPNGMALVCDDCGFAAGDMDNLTRHTLAEHGRSPSRDERSPRQVTR